MRFDPRLPSIVVPVTIEKRTLWTLKMVLDTGASYTLIPWSIAKAIGGEPEVSQKRVRIITASGTEFAPVVQLKSIAALGKRRVNFPVLCHDLPAETLVDGLLGLDFLRGSKWTFDLLAGEIRLD